MQKLIICTGKQLAIDYVPNTFPLNVPRLPQIGSDWPTILLIQLLCGVTAKTPKESGQMMRLCFYVDYLILFSAAFGFYVVLSSFSNIELLMKHHENKIITTNSAAQDFQIDKNVNAYNNILPHAYIILYSLPVFIPHQSFRP